MNESRPVVIVTGSSGLIGSALCDALAVDGARVVGFDRPGAPYSPKSAINVACDVTSETSTAQALDRVRRELGDTIAGVFHLAAYYDFSGEPSPLYDEVTVGGTERLLRQLHAFDVAQFVFSSTLLVHAPCEPGQHIDEDWPVDPQWDYPRSKLETEQVIRAVRGPIPVVLLRIAGVYTDRCQSIPIAHQMQRIYEKRLTATVFPGDISRGQSFVHLDDLIRAFRAVSSTGSSLPEEAVFLIGERDPVSYDELQRAFARLMHGDANWETVQIPKAVAKAGAWIQDVIPGVEDPFIKPWMIDLADQHYGLDTSRARRMLGWEPQRGLRDTLARMVDALEADPVAWYRENNLEGSPPIPRSPQPVGRRRA